MSESTREERRAYIRKLAEEVVAWSPRKRYMCFSQKNEDGVKKRLDKLDQAG